MLSNLEICGILGEVLGFTDSLRASRDTSGFCVFSVPFNLPAVQRHPHFQSESNLYGGKEGNMKVR